MKKKKKIFNTEKRKQEINKKIENLENKKKIIRNQFINDLIDVNEYHEITEEIQKQQNIQQSKILKLNEVVDDSKDSYTYDEIKDIVTNIKLNWQYLTNKEKQQFLERFVEEIRVDKSCLLYTSGIKFVIQSGIDIDNNRFTI